jgi:hypothetical protein
MALVFGPDDEFTGLFQIVPVFAFPALFCRTFLRKLDPNSKTWQFLAKLLRHCLDGTKSAYFSLY